jgi:hypothetical protein
MAYDCDELYNFDPEFDDPEYEDEELEEEDERVD